MLSEMEWKTVEIVHDLDFTSDISGAVFLVLKFVRETPISKWPSSIRLFRFFQ
jgi:hypothetical protein